MSKIFVLGGDGFCGWPTALHLPSVGHDVRNLDILVRREIDDELGVQSLTPIASMSERAFIPTALWTKDNQLDATGSTNALEPRADL